MFEDFRKQTEDAPFADDQAEQSSEEISSRRSDYFLGMTPAQRFVLAFMLLLMTLILGVLFLLVTSKIVLPFLG